MLLCLFLCLLKTETRPAARFNKKHLQLPTSLPTTAMQAWKLALYIDFRPRFSSYLLFIHFGRIPVAWEAFLRLDAHRGPAGARPAGGLGVLF